MICWHKWLPLARGKKLCSECGLLHDPNNTERFATFKKVRKIDGYQRRLNDYWDRGTPRT